MVFGNVPGGFLSPMACVHPLNGTMTVEYRPWDKLSALKIFVIVKKSQYIVYQCSFVTNLLQFPSFV